MSTATVTISLTELDELRRAKIDRENELAACKRELAEAKLNTSDDKTTRTLTELARNAIKVAAFAVSQMPPEATKGWPSAALRKVVELMPMLPDHDQNDCELAMDFTAFASECERWERYRASPTYSSQTHKIV